MTWRSVRGRSKGLGLRCDHGGMLWIKERAEAILQLRCIDINGDCEAFVDYVHDPVQRQAIEQGHPVRIQQQDPIEEAA